MEHDLQAVGRERAAMSRITRRSPPPRPAGLQYPAPPGARSRPGPSRHRIAPIRRIPRSLTALLAALMLTSGCGPGPSPLPQPPATDPAAVTPDPGSPAAVAPSGPAPTGGPGDPGPGPAAERPERQPASLPQPLLSDPFEIGIALYDPARVDVGVVSLLAVMGVGIYAPDGTPIRAGDEHEAGDPWLFDVEVRELIDRSAEELLASLETGDEALPISMADLHADLAVLVPDLDAGAFTRAYGDAYAEYPGDLVPQVLLGEPVDEAFRMTSFHAWLLMVDGFVGPAAERPAHLVPGALVAATGGPQWGTAGRAGLRTRYLGLTSLTPDEFEELLVHLRTLASLIGFDVVQSSVHEGHGGPGSRARIVAWLGPSVPLVSPTTGRRLLEQVNGDMGAPAGVDVRWASVDPAGLQQHGTLDRSLPAVTPADAGGEATLFYDPRREPANGVGFPGEDFASLYGSVQQRQLVEAFYVSNDAWLQQFVLRLQSLADPMLSRSRGFLIGFHGPGIELILENNYDVTTGVGIGMEARAHRIGTDRAKGLLTRYPDGTYRGLMHATVNSTTDMTLGLPLAGGECEARTEARQQLWVVGRVERGQGLTARDELTSGTAGNEDLVLSFYPLEPAGAVGACDAPIPYTGPEVVEGRAIVEPYLPFNDLRWSQPDTGYRIHLPDVGGLVYDDLEQFVPQWQVESIWTVDVDRSE